MATIIPPGYAQATLIWTALGDNEPYNCVIGVKLSGSETDPSIIASQIRGAWVANFVPANLSNRYTFQGARVTVGNDGTEPGPTGESIVPSAGTQGSTYLPSNCAALIRKRTARGGRSNRGRMFLPAGYVAESAVDENGVFQTASQGAMQVWSTGFLTSLAATSAVDDMVILHDSASPGDHVPTVVTALAVDSRIATQRLRMRR